MTYPSFSPGDVLGAADMNAVGLWLVKSQTIGSGVSSVTVTGAFSANYDNYRIVLSGVAGTTGAQSMKMSLNNSTGSTYGMGGIYGTFGSTAVNGYGPAPSTAWTDILPLETINSSGTIELFTPFLSTSTLFTSTGTRQGTAANGWYQMFGYDYNVASNTGFTLSPLVGTFTGGTIRVYGYRN